MIPTAANSDYPKFVADQVLTSDNLNDLFGYLDEQGRMTRTNLSGIGIVCGLEVKTAADGSSITITKGVGITSSGYLVSVPEITYTKRTTAVFDAVKCEYYDRFVNIGAKTQKFDLWELKQEAESTGTTALDNTFLSTGEKVVLLFVELLEENNKNCDPNSCDDKGVKVTVTVRPLLVEKSKVAGLEAGTATTSPWLELPDISMKRFNVAATPIYECLNIFESYRNILNSSFLTKLQTALTNAYTILQPVLSADFPDNPFTTLADDYKFLHDNSITSDQLVAIQYYYDLFSDVLQAYNEVKEKGTDVISMCCPDDPFPRHLLLDLAIPDATQQNSCYRHYFAPSRILNDESRTLADLLTLFRKLVLLLQQFKVPSMAIPKGGKITDLNIRITPSMLAGIPFSQKSIPYYYNIANANDKLLKNWNPEKLRQGRYIRNLSYHGINYAAAPEIKVPLLYDLEPYNFLRIEGHIGKPYKHAVKNILALRDKARLPFEVVALNADISATIAFFKNLLKSLVSGSNTSQATLQDLMGGDCHFNDLELLYDSIQTELTSKLGNEMKFFYDVTRDAKRGVLNMPPPTSNVPQAMLLKKTDASFKIKNNTIGLDFELFYAGVKNQPLIPFNVFFLQFGHNSNIDFVDFMFEALLYYMEMLYRTITTSLSSFSFSDFLLRYYTVTGVVKFIKLAAAGSTTQVLLKEEENDHLDAILNIAADGRMAQLYLEFIVRIAIVKIMQQAGYYFDCNPGIQHKGGVPMGGTFILVYHENAVTETEESAAAAETEESFSFAGAGVKKMTGNDLIVENQAVFVKAAEGVAGMGNEVNATDVSSHMQIVSAGIQENISFMGNRVAGGFEASFQAASAKNQQLKKGTSGSQKLASGAGASAARSATSEVQSSKQAAMAYLVESITYLKNRPSDDLDEIIEDFNDGIVIADFYLPYLCCSDCPPIQMVIGAEPPNQAPVARPGDNVSVELPTDFVNFDGSSSSDPDGIIKTYLWEKQSGGDAVIETGGESKTKVSGLKEGGYIFKLTVTDDDGASDSATVTVTVLPKPNTAPVAVASASPNLVTLTQATVAETQLSSAGSFDPDGDPITFDWSLPQGTTGATIIGATDQNPKAQFTLAGVYVFTLKVKDPDGAEDTATVTVTVNRPPVANAIATPSTVTLSVNNTASVQLSSSGSSDPDGDAISFNWSLPQGTQGATISDATAANPTVLFTAAGVYTFTLRVTDSRGATATKTVTVTVNRPPIAIANATPSSVNLTASGAATVQLSSTGSSDPDGDPITFNWSLPAGTQGAAISNATAANPTAQFTAAGVFVFTLKVMDSRGGIATTTATVTVNRPPIANATATPTAATLSANNTATVQLISTSSDPDGDTLTYQWTLAAGASGAIIRSATSPSTAVDFNQAGTYNFILTVKDSKNATATKTVTVVINSRVNTGPTARASIAPTALNIGRGQTVDATLSGSQSSDPEGDALTFNWSQTSGSTAAKIANPKNATTKVTFSSAGAYQFTLKVTDTGNKTSSATITINVLPIPG